MKTDQKFRIRASPENERRKSTGGGSVCQAALAYNSVRQTRFIRTKRRPVIVQDVRLEGLVVSSLTAIVAVDNILEQRVS